MQTETVLYVFHNTGCVSVIMSWLLTVKCKPSLPFVPFSCSSCLPLICISSTLLPSPQLSPPFSALQSVAVGSATWWDWSCRHYGALWHRVPAPGGVLQRLSPWRGEPADACAWRSQMYDMHTQITNKSWTYHTHRNTPSSFTLIVMPNKTPLLICNKSFAAQWHHIENLDLFFQRISFYTVLACIPYVLCSECLWRLNCASLILHRECFNTNKIANLRYIYNFP